MVGHSLGGLWARYAVGLLYDRGLLKRSSKKDNVDSDDADEGLEPMLFTTFATPHVGSVFQGTSKRASLFNYIGRTLFGQSGRDLFLLSEPDWLFPGSGNGSGDTRPIIEQMSDPANSSYKALSLFKHLTLFANATNDLSVPFYTSYISLKDPFKILKHVHIAYLKRHAADDKTHEGDRMLAEIDVKLSKYHRKDGSQTIPEKPEKNSAFLSTKTQLLVALCAVGPVVVPLAFTFLIVCSTVSDFRARRFNSQQEQGTPVQIPNENNGNIPDILNAVADGGNPDETTILPNLHLFDPSIPNLNLDPQVIKMINSLNRLPWDKHITRFHLVSTHEEIINARNSAGPGQDLIKDWAASISSKL